MDWFGAYSLKLRAFFDHQSMLNQPKSVARGTPHATVRAVSLFLSQVS
jgi:hypothetical protein